VDCVRGHGFRATCHLRQEAPGSACTHVPPGLPEPRTLEVTGARGCAVGGAPYRAARAGARPQHRRRARPPPAATPRPAPPRGCAHTPALRLSSTLALAPLRFLAPSRSVSLSRVYLRLSIALFRAMPSPRVVTVRQRPGIRPQRGTRASLRPPAGWALARRQACPAPTQASARRGPFSAAEHRRSGRHQAGATDEICSRRLRLQVPAAECAHATYCLFCLKSYLVAGHSQDFPDQR